MVSSVTWRWQPAQILPRIGRYNGDRRDAGFIEMEMSPLLRLKEIDVASSIKIVSVVSRVH